MKELFYYSIFAIVLYFVLTYVFDNFNLEQENFDPSLVPISSIVTLAKVAQKLVNGNGILTNPGNLQIGASATTPGNLIVMGKTIINGNNADTALAVTGNTTLNGTLNVTGDTTVENTLNVTGATTLKGTLNITGNTTVGGTLNVTGTTTLGGTLGVTGNTKIENKLEVTGSTTLSATTVNGELEAGDTTLASATVNGELKAGATTLASAIVTGTLGVTGNTTLASTTVSGALDVTGDTTVVDANVDGTLGVTGLTTLASATVSGALGVTGDTTLASATVNGTLGVTGDTTLASATVTDILDVIGATTLSSATVNGNLIINSNGSNAIMINSRNTTNDSGITKIVSDTGSTGIRFYSEGNKNIFECNRDGNVIIPGVAIDKGSSNLLVNCIVVNYTFAHNKAMSCTNGTNVIMSDPDYANDNQYWIINNNRIIHAATGKCLTSTHTENDYYNKEFTLQPCDRTNVKQKFEMKESDLGFQFFLRNTSDVKIWLRVEPSNYRLTTSVDYNITYYDFTHDWLIR